MEKFNIFKYALNLTKLMQSLSDIVKDDFNRTSKHLDELPLHDYIGTIPEEDFLYLESLGLDDMGMSGINIELSQDRTNFKIWSPYHEEYKDALKRSIPKFARRWDSDEKCWRIHIDWFGNAQRLLEIHYPNIKREYTNRALSMCEELVEEEKIKKENKHTQKKRSKRKKQRKKSRKKEKTKTYEEDNNYYDEHDSWNPSYSQEYNPYKILGVQENAPDEIVKAAYKAQARLNHTDLTKTDDRKMKEINTAYEAIRKEREWTNK